ncbi:MAG: hypothetical protein RBS17_08000 [Coriobacteriia bacterium]|nr:hypothetical protein [Coriobacteriia bacterium]
MQTRDKHDNDNVRRIFEAIARDTIANNGGTYQHKTGAEVDLHARYGSGYVVSVAEYGEAIAAPIASLWERIARAWPSHIGADVQYVGTWQHRGLVFVDGSIVLPESARDIALALARKHGQTAIYNIRTHKSEYVSEAE